MKADVAAMNITKALIAKAKGPQLLQTTVQLKWSEKLALCKFASVDDAGKVIGEHANCELHFKETSKLDVVQVDASAIRAKMVALRAGMSTGKSFLFNKNMVYKMVTALADFDPNYRGIESIVLDSDAMEACSTVNFAGLKNEGEFHTHPAFIDALSQVAGFVMNANDKSDLSQEVFVNHGWSSFQILEPILATKRYSTYVKMRETQGKMWRGDITVFDDEKVVAWFGDIALQGVPRRLLRYILAAEGGSTSKAGTQANSTQSKPHPRAAANQRSPEKDAAKSQQLDQRKEQTEITQPKISSDIISSSLAPKKSRGDSKKILQVLQVISEESGIAVDDLTESSEFADLGVDSLLSMLIISRLNDEMAIELDTSAFIDMPTIKHLKDFLCPDDPGQEEEPNPILKDPAPPRRPDPIPVPNTRTITKNDELQVHLVSEKLQPQDQASKREFEQVLQILAEESGITIDELTDDSNFADLGVDSLLSLMIVSRLQEELGIGQDWDSSLWADCATIGALRERLGGKQDESDSDVESEDKFKGSQEASDTSASTPPHERWVEVDGKPTPLESEHSDQPKPQSRPQLVQAPPASSVILQGRVKLARRVLFLFPDGSGSAHSYAKLPNIHDDLAIVGLNCPFRKDAQLMENCPLDALIDSYITEIRKRQPSGPYYLGGWSAGGILAYRATQQFIREGEEVLSLVLIDSPAPKGLDRLPQHFYDHCNAINLFGAKVANSDQVAEAPEWLIPHFNATITVLHNYWADPLPQWSTPQTSIIWASECVFDGVKFPRLPPSPDDTEGMKFLTEKRSDFSAGEWADLFPGDEVTVEVAHGADHFSLLNEQADVLARFIDRATF
jgi:iterative type I PKS product template protein